MGGNGESNERGRAQTLHSEEVEECDAQHPDGARRTAVMWLLWFCCRARGEKCEIKQVQLLGRRSVNSLSVCNRQ